jgi:hypothetical protein
MIANRFCGTQLIAALAAIVCGLVVAGFGCDNGGSQTADVALPSDWPAGQADRKTSADLGKAGDRSNADHNTPSPDGSRADQGAHLDAPTTSHQAQCGTTTCDLTVNFCCINSFTDTPHCCPMIETTEFIACYNDADCGANGHGLPYCCAVQWTSDWDLACGGVPCSVAGGIKACRTQADCPSGVPCLSQTRHGLVLQTCGQSPP